MHREEMTAQEYNHRQFDRLYEKMAEWVKVSRRSMAESVSRTGNDIRIKMSQLFRGKRWGGTGRRSKLLAYREMLARSKAGKGTVLRKGLTASPEAPKFSSTGRRLTMRQRLVWTELLKRQTGIGVLGAALLLKRWNAKQTKLVRNTTGYKGRELASFFFGSHEIMDKAEYVLTDFVPGTSKVDQKYQIVSKALIMARWNIQKYLTRKQNEAMAATVCKP